MCESGEERKWVLFPLSWGVFKRVADSDSRAGQWVHLVRICSCPSCDLTGCVGRRVLYRSDCDWQNEAALEGPILDGILKDCWKLKCGV